jgi:hypothetical protein
MIDDDDCDDRDEATKDEKDDRRRNLDLDLCERKQPHRDRKVYRYTREPLGERLKDTLETLHQPIPTFAIPRIGTAVREIERASVRVSSPLPVASSSSLSRPS